MKTVLEKELATLIADCQKTYTGFHAESVWGDVLLTTDQDVRFEQKYQLDNTGNYLNAAIGLENAFSGQERQYYNVVFLGEEQMQNTQAPEISKRAVCKSGMIGGIALCLLLAVGLGIKYISNDKVKTCHEIEDYCGIRVLGRYDSRSSVRGVARLANRLEEKSYAVPSNVDYLAESIGLLSEKQLAIVGIGQSDTTAALLKNLKTRLPDAVIGISLLEDSDMIKTAKASAGLTLIVQKGISSYAEIKRVQDICAAQNISILGAIVAE